MQTPAPICVFLFNRPQHLRRTLETLVACEGFGESAVYVFGDGPKEASQVADVEAARGVARDLLGDRAAYQFAPSNKGLARSIIEGVTEIVVRHGRAIVVEDDLALAPQFLRFMNAALDRYAGDTNVYQVSGYAFDVPELADDSAVFLPFIATWGWGTWARAWAHFDERARGWNALRTDPGLRRRFNLGGAYDYTSMMERQMAGMRDSWGIRWYWSVFVEDGLVLFPPRSLVRNEGMDGTGSHGRGFFRRYAVNGVQARDGLPAFPPAKLNQKVVNTVQKAIWRQNGGLIGAWIDSVKRLRAPSWLPR